MKDCEVRIGRVFTVHRNNDDRHDGNPTDFFSDKAAADARAKGRGWYGSDAPVNERAAIFVKHVNGVEVYLLDSRITAPVDLDGVKSTAHEARRKAALAKLTADDLEALGLDKP